MKIFLPLFLFLTTLSTSDGLACNTCGCGVANYHYGILPQFQKNFLGLRYRYRSYISRLDAGHTTPYSYETFQTTELWARFYPMKNLQAFVFVPYNFNERREGEETLYLNGPGDIVVSANYNVINTYDTTATFHHSLLVGTGVKLPTGQFRKIQDGLTINQNFQLGTGSFDALFNLIYTLRYKNVGLNTEFTYSHNTKNRDEYKFGNTARSSLTAFIVPKTGSVTLMPNVGVSVETNEDNKQFGQAFPETGGWAMFYNAGLESYYKNIAVGISYSHPGKQQLFDGKVSSNDRVSVHLTYMF